MSATTISPTDLLSAHAELVEKRSASGLTAGVAASLSRKIGETELTLELEGIEYQPYIAPSKSVASMSELTDAQVTALFDEAVKTRIAATTSGFKASGTSTVKRVAAELERRGIKVEVPSFGVGSATSALSAEDLSRKVHQLRALLSRGDQVRPRIRKLAESELRTLTDQAGERDIPISDSVATESDESAVAALDSRKGRRTAKTAAKS
jgi:hypothetical protein